VGEKNMIIECIENRTAKINLLDFLKDNGFNSLELQLLVFWAKHPNAKLSLYSIANALDTAKLSLREAIYALVRKNMILEQHNNNDLTTYYLNGNWNPRSFIEELSCLDWSQLKVLKKQLEGGAVLN
jgi:hypothetical protein